MELWDYEHHKDTLMVSLFSQNKYLEYTITSTFVDVIV
jgi:hypothetical protein